MLSTIPESTGGPPLPGKHLPAPLRVIFLLGLLWTFLFAIALMGTPSIPRQGLSEPCWPRPPIPSSV